MIKVSCQSRALSWNVSLLSYPLARKQGQKHKQIIKVSFQSRALSGNVCLLSYPLARKQDEKHKQMIKVSFQSRALSGNVCLLSYPLAGKQGEKHKQMIKVSFQSRALCGNLFLLSYPLARKHVEVRRSSVPPFLNLMSVFFSNLTYLNFGILAFKIRNKNTRRPSSSVMKGGRMHQVLGVLRSPFGVEQSLLCGI